MSDLKSYSNFLEETEGLDRSLILGNGFSIQQTLGAFTFKNLLSVSDFKGNQECRKLFEDLETVDFELVIRSLEEASQVVLSYGNQELAQRLKDDAVTLREVLITAIRRVHPEDFSSIGVSEIESCSGFLNTFGKIFSLNYDLLLYWVTLSKGGFSDGFGLGERSGKFQGPFDKEAYCKIFNLHGGLHLFPTASGGIQKICRTTSSILGEIASEIQSGAQLPVFVAEGSAEQKLAKIRENPYLNHCLECLERLNGVVFIFGHSAKPNDGHLYDAIFNSQVSEIFFSVHDPEINLQGIKESLAPFRERSPSTNVSFVDSSSVSVWNRT